MKDEYGMLLIGFFFVLGLHALSYLIVDLWVDDFFGKMMIASLIFNSVFFSFVFLIQAFRTNYMIVRRIE